MAKGSLGREKEHATGLKEALFNKYPDKNAIVKEFIKETDPDFDPKSWNQFSNSEAVILAFEEYLNGGEEVPVVAKSYSSPGNAALFSKLNAIGEKVTSLKVIFQSPCSISVTQLQGFEREFKATIAEQEKLLQECSLFIRSCE